jgi:hypothetical protein
MKEIVEIFSRRWELRAFKKFQKQEGEGLNVMQQVVAYLRYFNGNIKRKYFRKGSGRREIAKRTGIPEYQVQIIIAEFTYPTGTLPQINSKYEI